MEEKKSEYSTKLRVSFSKIFIIIIFRTIICHPQIIVCANIQKNSAKKIIAFVAATNVYSNHKVFMQRIDIFFLIKFEDCRDYLLDEFKEAQERKNAAGRTTDMSHKVESKALLRLYGHFAL